MIAEATGSCSSSAIQPPQWNIFSYFSKKETDDVGGMVDDDCLILILVVVVVIGNVMKSIIMGEQ